MDESSQADVLKRISKGVSQGMALLPPHLRVWAEAHVVEPRPIRAALDVDGKSWSEFMLVTDDVGHADSDYRVVYDPAACTFGTVTQVKDGPLWFLGSDDTFDAAVANM